MAIEMEMDEEFIRDMRVRVTKKVFPGSNGLDARLVLCGCPVQIDSKTGEQYFEVPAIHVAALKKAHQHQGYEFGKQYKIEPKAAPGRPKSA